MQCTRHAITAGLDPTRCIRRASIANQTKTKTHFIHFMLSNISNPHLCIQNLHSFFCIHVHSLYILVGECTIDKVASHKITVSELCEHKSKSHNVSVMTLRSDRIHVSYFYYDVGVKQAPANRVGAPTPRVFGDSEHATRIAFDAVAILGTVIPETTCIFILHVHSSHVLRLLFYERLLYGICVPSKHRDHAYVAIYNLCYWFNPRLHTARSTCHTWITSRIHPDVTISKTNIHLAHGCGVGVGCETSHESMT